LRGGGGDEDEPPVRVLPNSGSGCETWLIPYLISESH